MNMGCFLTKMLTWKILCQWEPVTTNRIPSCAFSSHSLTIHDTEEGRFFRRQEIHLLFFFSPSGMKSFHREIFLANCQLIWSLESSYLNSTGQFFCQTHLADLHSQWENHHLQPPLGCCAHFWTFNSSSLWFCLFICTVLNRVCPGGNVRLTDTTQNNCIIGNVTMTAVIKADNKTKAH